MRALARTGLKRMPLALLYCLLGHRLAHLPLIVAALRRSHLFCSDNYKTGTTVMMLRKPASGTTNSSLTL
jgi:hypothetical protein